MILQTTLALAAAASLMTIWLVFRVAGMRQATKIAHGDGGNELLGRRMRAQANFVENTPFILILVATIELADKGGTWLAVVGAVYMLGRISHVFGMDAEGAPPARVAGALITLATHLGLAVVAVLIVLKVF